MAAPTAVSARSVSARAQRMIGHDAADIGERDQQRRLALHAAQLPHRLVDVLGRGGRAAVVGQQRGKMRLRLGLHHPQQTLRIAA